MAGNNAFTDLGVESSYMGNTEDLEDFLNDKKPTDDEEEEVEETEEEKKKKEAAKNKTSKKKPTPEEEIDREALGSKAIDSIKDEEEEEETEEEEVKEEDEENTDEAETQPKVPDVQKFTEDLFKLNILTKDQSDENKAYTTQEQLVERLNYEKQKGAVQWLEGFLGQFGEDRAELFDAIFVNGADPKEYLPVFNKLNDYKDLDLTTEDNQKKVFREFYRRVQLDEAVIEKRLQKTVDYGDLKDEAEALHAQLVAQDAQRAKELSEKSAIANQQKQREEDQYKQGVVSVIQEKLKTKDVNGFPINDVTARKVADMLTTKKYKAPGGELLTELDKQILDTRRPENHWKRVLLGLLFESNFDLTRVARKAVSQENNALFTSLTEKVAKRTKTQSAMADKKTATASIWDKI